MSATWDPGPAGTSGDDLFFGSDTTDVAAGLGGDDILDGNGGADILGGGDGNDILIGGPGADVVGGGNDNDLVIWRAGDGSDVVGLGTGNDTLDLEGWTGGTDDPWDTAAGGGLLGGTLFTNGTDTIRVTDFNPAEDAITCFAAGTMIAAARGEVPVEALRVGDLVVTAGGGAPLKPIRWIGHSRVNVARQPDRGRAAPILITAGALADGVPHRDLRVSPEHALFLDGALVPARLLVNGTTIVQEVWCAEVTYWHVELEAHGLLVSEGAVSESYFDDGNRHFFDNHAITALVKDFAGHRANGRYRAAACAPVLDDGPALARIRRRLDARVAMAAAPRRASA